MNTCALCRVETAASDLATVSGLDFCGTCRHSDPRERLAEVDVAVEWHTGTGWFNAGLGLAGQDPAFSLRCVPELWYHKLWKLLFKDLDVGDSTFDHRIYVRTSDPVRAREVLSVEGVQSAVLALLSDVRVNDLRGNHVILKGPTLLVSTRPLGGLPEDRIQELKMEATALALHLRTGSRAARTADASRTTPC